MQRTNRWFPGMTKTGTLVLASIMVALAGCNGKTTGPEAASRSGPESAVKKPPVKKPPVKKPPVKKPPVKKPPVKKPPATPKKPPVALENIPQPPKPKNDKQKFVLYDVKYIVDVKMKGYAIIARVWTRKPELYKKPGIRAVFLTFDKPVKGDLSGMTGGNFRLTGGGLSWRTQNPSGQAQGLKGSSAWAKQYGVVSVTFKYSFLSAAMVKNATFGFMLRGDKDFKPVSNVFVFDREAFEPGDAKKEFAKVNAQVEALGQTDPSGK